MILFLKFVTSLILLVTAHAQVPTAGPCQGNPLEASRIDPSEHLAWGYDRPDCTSHIYTFKLKDDVKVIDVNAIDKTGAAQCLWFDKAILIPPKSSGLAKLKGFGNNVHLGYRSASGHPLPKGKWRLRLRPRAPNQCVQTWQISFRLSN